LLLLLSPVFGGSAFAMTVYTDRAEFVAANPGLLTEDFETNNVTPTSTSVCTNPPMDSTTDNACFNPGQLLPGVTYDLPDTPIGDKMALGRPDDPLSYRLGANSNGDYAVIRFAAGDVTAAGLELSCSFGPKNAIARFYGTNGLITEEATTCSGSGTFIGISGDEYIVRIEAEAPGTFEYLDNLTFGKPTSFTTFDNRDTFTTTYPVLALEDFESGNLAEGELSKACPSSLAVALNNDCFAQGDIQPGVEFRLQDNPGFDMLILAEESSKVLGPFPSTDYLYVRFSDALAVGLDVYCPMNPGQASVRFYNAKTVFAELTIDCSEAGTFIGLAASERIEHIEVELPDGAELIDNVLFGRALMQIMFKDDFE